MGYYDVKTKKELKTEINKPPKFRETSMFGAEYKGDGTYYIVGPDPYKSRKWYAKIEVLNGVVSKVS